MAAGYLSSMRQRTCRGTGPNHEAPFTMKTKKTDPVDSTIATRAYEEAWRDALRIIGKSRWGWCPHDLEKISVLRLKELVGLFAVVHSQAHAQMALDLAYLS